MGLLDHGLEVSFAFLKVTKCPSSGRLASRQGVLRSSGLDNG